MTHDTRLSLQGTRQTLNGSARFRTQCQDLKSLSLPWAPQDNSQILSLFQVTSSKRLVEKSWGLEWGSRISSVTMKAAAKGWGRRPSKLLSAHRYYSPNIFVTAVGQEVEGTELTVHSGQVEAQEQGQHLH